MSKTILLILLSFCTLTLLAKEPQVIEKCDKTMRPINNPKFDLPVTDRNAFTGFALFEFIVQIDGTIREPVMTEQEWESVSRHNRQSEPVDYIEAMLKALSQYQYEPIAKECLHRHKFKIDFED